MISFALKVGVFSGLFSLLGWAASLVAPAPYAPSLELEASGLEDAFRDPSVAQEFLRSSRAASRSLDRTDLSFAPAGVRQRLAAGLAITKIHARILEESLPVLVAVLAASLALGLARREGLRSGMSFASPTRAYLGKHLAVAAAVTLVTFALAPVPLGPWSVWWGGAGTAAGLYSFVANLPLKL
jgi:hypothetical protein